MRKGPLNRRSTSLAALAGAVLFAGASPAAAQPVMGAPGSWALTGEDMVGYFSEHADYKDENNLDFAATRNYLSLPFRTAGTKIGLHYFVIPSLSVGGALGFESRSGSNTYQDNPGTYTRSVATETTFLFQPKVGYLLMLTPIAGFWFRAGVGVRYDQRRANEFEPDSRISDTSWHLSGDVLFVVTPVTHFGFYIGPTGDLSFTGTHHEHIVRNDGTVIDWSHGASYNRLGLGLGLIGYF